MKVHSPKIWVSLVENEAQKKICFTIRQKVFVEGQNVPPHEEWDELDDRTEACPHFIAWAQTQEKEPVAVGTARLWLYQEQTSKAQRVAVLEEWRSTGVGRALMQRLETFTWETGRTSVVLGAQTQAIPFYEKLGYEAFGPEYLDAGIPHRDMKKER